MSAIPRAHDKPPAADEESALLSPTLTLTGAPARRKYGARAPTPLPKLQLSVLMLLQLSEPMTSHMIYPFINQLVGELDIVHGDERLVGYYAGLIQSLFFATEALTVLHWSRLSDRIGRKPVLLIGLAGLAASMVLFGLSRTFWTLVLSRCLAGALNGNIGIIKSAVGELTDSSNMAKAFGWMPVMWAAGVTVAPFIGGTLARPHDRFPKVFTDPFWQRYPYLLPCLVSSAFSACAFAITLVVFKEPSKTHIKSRTRSSSTDTLIADTPHYGATSPAPAADGSESDAAVPVRALLVRPVLLSVANYCTLAVLDIAFGALQPLMYATRVAHGGLGFAPATIGGLLGLFGVMNGLVQGVFFSTVVRAVGLRTTFMCGMGAFVPLFALFPVLSALARAHGGMAPLAWAVLGVQFVCWVAMDMCYGCIFMYITSAAPNKRSLGATNGLAQLSASIVRTVGPAAATSLFAVSQARALLGGQLVYVVLVCAAVGAVAVAARLPAEAWDMGDMDDMEEESAE